MNAQFPSPQCVAAQARVSQHVLHYMDDFKEEPIIVFMHPTLFYAMFNKCSGGAVCGFMGITMMPDYSLPATGVASPILWR